MKPHVSPSQIEMLAKCPEQYRRRYVCREIIPPGIALLVGTGYHRGAEHNFRQKIETHADLPASQIIEAAVAGFELEQSAGYMLSTEEDSRGVKIVLGEAKDQVAALADLHAKEQAPDYQPVAVEHTTRIVFPDATHDLLGVTDLRDDQRRVVDFKTAAKKKPQSEADSSLQLTVYAAAHQIDTGEPCAECRLDTVTKTKTPARQVLTTTRGEADYRALLSRVNAMIGALAAFKQAGLEIWPGAPVGAWQCGPRWCGFWNTCSLVNSERKAAAAANEE